MCVYCNQKKHHKHVSAICILLIKVSYFKELKFVTLKGKNFHTFKDAPFLFTVDVFFESIIRREIKGR